MSAQAWSPRGAADDSSDAVLEFVVRGIEAEAEEIAGRSASVCLGSEREPISGGGPTARFPLDAGGESEGELCVDAAEPLFTRGQRRALLALATRAAAALSAARGQAEAAAAAFTDPVTGLANRRQLDLDLSDECAAARRYGRPLSLTLIDIDEFKRFNDTQGHPAGDAALRVVGGALASTVRRTDRAYRYGGDEFAILLPETSLERATRLADRVRDSVRASRLSAGRHRLSVSAGVADVAAACDPVDFLSRADAALYEAKRLGRDRVARADRARRRDQPASRSA